jgi:hypothetical protein
MADYGGGRFAGSTFLGRHLYLPVDEADNLSSATRPLAVAVRSYDELMKGAAVLSRRGWIASGVVVLVAVMVGVGVAAAAIPDNSTGIITACYHKQRGTLRVIDAQTGERCRKREGGCLGTRTDHRDLLGRWDPKGSLESPVER